MTNRLSKKVGLLLLVAGLALSLFGFTRQAARAAEALQVEIPEEVMLANGFRIHFDGVEYHADSTSTWLYTVEELPDARDLGYWVLEVPLCAPVLDAEPDPWEKVDPDPNTLLSGVKWEPGEDFQSGQFWVRVDGAGQVGITSVAAKSGPDVAFGKIAGPTCVEDQPGDYESPTIHWLAPVGAGERYDVQEGDVVTLIVDAADNVAVERVRFLRWDAVNEGYVTIADDAAPPWQTTVSASELNPTWNQIFAASYDSAGNRSDWQTIWLYKVEYEPVLEPDGITIFLPVIHR